MDIRKQVYRRTYFYIASMLLAGAIAAVFYSASSSWGLVGIAVLLLLFSIWSAHTSFFFYKMRGVFKYDPAHSLGYISSTFHNKRIVTTATLAVCLFIIAIMIAFHVIFL